jgi:hypothetical protein
LRVFLLPLVLGVLIKNGDRLANGRVIAVQGIIILVGIF